MGASFSFLSYYNGGDFGIVLWFTADILFFAENPGFEDLRPGYFGSSGSPRMKVRLLWPLWLKCFFTWGLSRFGRGVGVPGRGEGLFIHITYKFFLNIKTSS